MRRIAIVCALVGCATEEKPTPERVDVPMTLAELPGLDVYFYRYLGDRLWNPGADSFAGHITYRHSDLVDDVAGVAGCARLESLSASINGFPLEIFDLGHWPAEFPNEACIEPVFGFHRIPEEVRQLENATLVIEDASRSITAELGDTFVPRVAIPSGGDWDFQPGETVEFQWSPAADLTTALPRVAFLGPTDPPQDHIEFRLDHEQISVSGDTVVFTLPERTLEGALFIEFSGGPDVACGDIDCHLNAGQRVHHDAKIAP